MARIFVATRIEGAAAAAVASTQGVLRSRIAAVKWVDREHLHLTLRFFGEVSVLDGTLERIEAVVREVTGGTTAFPLSLEGVGSFPARGSPRVVWIGVEDGAVELTALASALEDGFAAAGLGREERPFRPHLTVGRRRQERGGEVAEPRAVREVLESTDFGPRKLEISRVWVVESVLGRGGPRYTDRAVFSLRPVADRAP